MIAYEIQDQAIEVLRSFKIRHVSALVEYMEPGIRQFLRCKTCMSNRKNAVLPAPDDQSRNIYVTDIFYDRVEDIRTAAED
jgi:hypothetical protein